MKKKGFKFNYIFIILLVLLFLGFGSFVVNMIADRFIQSNDNNEPAVSENVDINWAELYQFSDDAKEAKATENSVQNSSDEAMLTKIVNKYKSATDTANSFVGNNSNYFFMSDAINNVGVKTRQTLYKVELFEGIALNQIENKQLIEIEEKNEEYGIDAASSVGNFNSYLKKKDIPFLYVQPLTKYDETGRFKTYVNENRDAYINALRNKGIEVLDLRDNAKEEQISVDDAFYKTDHHWKTSMGLWAAQRIAKQLGQNYDTEFDSSLLKTENFTLKVYKDAMMGSYGATAGPLWCDYEDHPVYYPNYSTSFKLEIPSKEIKDEGSFEILFNNEKLKEFTDGTGNYVYETTCYGNTPLTKITNLNNKNAPRVLIIRDSFALAVMPYLACACSELDSIDMRENNGNFNGSVKAYIEEFKPDAVIMIYSNAQPKDIN